jgi:hypothetical protein
LGLIPVKEDNFLEFCIFWCPITILLKLLKELTEYEPTDPTELTFEFI